jgi:hypothetical protein
MRLIAIVSFAGMAMGGLVFGYLTRAPHTESTSPGATRPGSSWVRLLQGSSRHIEDSRLTEAALHYVRAVQQGDTDEIVRRTAWMQQRLRQLEGEGVSPAELEKTRSAFAARMAERPIEGNQLHDSGVRDQYLFAPGATIEVLGHDAGADDLTRPVAQRTWLRVTYPSRMHALVDMAGQPVRSVVAGLNMDSDGMIVKAGVIGNAELRLYSIEYNWPPENGD